MHLFYRISDKSYVKPKLPGATKEVCLKNFLTAFSDLIFSDEVMNEGQEPPCTVIADNCTRPTMKLLGETGLPIIETSLGNAQSLQKALKLACELPDNEIVYFCEDDYLHKATSFSLIEEGLKHADYVTLFDHPDKYTNFYQGGETSKVLKTSHSHWRFTISTCMTFGTSVSTLKQDFDIWKKWTEGSHPEDHNIFLELNKKDRKLILPIPGAACHLDLTFHGQVNNLLIEDWVIDYLCQVIEKELPDEAKEIVGRKKGWQRLKMLDAIFQATKKPG